MDYIQRNIQPYLHKIYDAFPTVTLCGPRQSGKTTLCRKEFPDLEYVNFENPSLRQIIAEDPLGFVAQYKKGAIFDEVQLVPDIFSALQIVIDEDRFNNHPARKFILTGSSNFSLLPNLRQSLAGRTGIVTLLPFSVDELVKGGFLENVDTYIFQGGYPGVWDSSTELKTDIMESYINTYVERDVRRIMEVKDLNKFTLFLKLCAARIGTELNRSSIAVELGVAVSTIENWLSVLQATYILFLLKPWHSNIGKRLTKSPKLYFYDTGLASTLLNINNSESLFFNPMRGQLFENMVISNQIKKLLNFGIKDEIFFYRDKSGKEIDLLIQTSEGINAYEIKSGASYKSDYMNGIKYLKKILGDSIVKSGVIYAGEAELAKQEEGIYNYLNPTL